MTTMPWYTLKQFYKKQFGCHIRKVSVHAGLDCPNRDGSIGDAGCIFCENAGFSPHLTQAGRSVREQILRQTAYLENMDKRLKGFIAYFQSYTNTYAPLATLKQLYDDALSVEGVRGLAVGTRPDCVPDDVLGLIASYLPDALVSLELGLQSAHDKTLQGINRGHTVAVFSDAVKRATDRGLDVCAHVILFLPGESREDMIATADYISALPIRAIKIHHLHVVQETPLATLFASGKVVLPEMDTYIEMLYDFIGHLRPEIVVERIMGSCPEERLIGPDWTQEKAVLILKLQKLFERRGTRQGDQLCMTLN